MHCVYFSIFKFPITTQIYETRESQRYKLFESVEIKME